MEVGLLISVTTINSDFKSYSNENWEFMRIQAFLVTFVTLQVPQESNLIRGHVRTMQACNG